VHKKEGIEMVMVDLGLVLLVGGLIFALFVIVSIAWATLAGRGPFMWFLEKVFS
jgi:hypothetical protein